ATRGADGSGATRSRALRSRGSHAPVARTRTRLLASVQRDRLHGALRGACRVNSGRDGMAGGQRAGDEGRRTKRRPQECITAGFSSVRLSNRTVDEINSPYGTDAPPEGVGCPHRPAPADRADTVV